MEFRDYPLSNRTSFRIGGPAERFVMPETEADLGEALRRASEEGLPIRALGGGKNLLVDDLGVRGLVVAFHHLKGVEIDGDDIRAGAGTALAALLQRTVACDLAGLEGLAGVPGTVGGAVRMNAGGAHGAIGDRVVWVRGFDRTGREFRFDAESCGFRYRGSRLGGLFVTEVGLRLERARYDLKGRVDRIFNRKRASQPLTASTAGCMFKNPVLPRGESAGWLLDQAGLKGVRRGGARYSELHANFIENTGDAACEDVFALIREGRRRVSDRFGVDLELEVEVWKREEEDALLVA